MIEVGNRVYHQRSDLFGKVEKIEGDKAFVKYEWPVDDRAEARQVSLEELRLATWQDPV